MKWTSFVLLFVIQSASAASLSDLSFLYYKEQINKKETGAITKMSCDPSNARPVSCFKAVAKLLPESSTDDSYEIKAIVEMCKNNTNGGCIESAVARLPQHSKDDLYDFKEIINRCSALSSGVCVGVFTKYLSESSIDDSYEVYDVIKKCEGISDDVADCADFTCSRLSASSCDDTYDVVSVLKSCSRNF